MAELVDNNLGKLMSNEELIYAKAYHKGVGAGYDKALCDVIDLVSSDDFWIKIRISEFPQTTMIEEIGKLGGMKNDRS